MSIINEAFDFTDIDISTNINGSLPAWKRIMIEQQLQNLIDRNSDGECGYPSKKDMDEWPDAIWRPETYTELQDMIFHLLQNVAKDVNLNWIDVTEVTDMSALFIFSGFSGDVSRWDVSRVLNMQTMFMYSDFDGDLSKWDVSNVVIMGGMFKYSPFTGDNGDISGWDVSSVHDINDIFNESKFRHKLDNWVDLLFKGGMHMDTI